VFPVVSNMLLKIAISTILFLSVTTSSIASSSSFPLKLLRSFEENVVNKAKQKSNFKDRLFSKLKPFIRRKLDNNGYDDDYMNYYADDDAQDGDDYVDDGQLYYGEFAFDIAKYSLKYARCQSINTWSDDMAQDEDATDILMQKKFIVFRLCPYNYCSSDSSYGCKNNYGEYIIELDDYLQLMKEEWADKIDGFCEYCDGCYRRRRNMRNLAGDDAADDYYAAGGNYDDAADDAVAADDAGDDYNAGDDAGDNEVDEEEEDDDANDNDCDQMCTTYSNVCSNRSSNNNNDDGNNNADDNYDNILECMEYENDDGLIRYIGPHCSSDGRSIVLGLFSDAYCTQVVGDAYDAASFTGLNLEYNTLSDYSPKQCIACNAQSAPYLDYDEGNDEDDASIIDICKELYYSSAKCNQNLKQLNTYKSSNQEATEQLVCNFISNVVTSQYDEYGDIYVSNGDYYHQNTYFKNEVVKDVSTMQILGLCTSMFICMFLLLYACYLHRAILRKAPWRPRRGGTEALAGQISRQNSGIVMGRSRSGGSYRGPTGGTLI